MNQYKINKTIEDKINKNDKTGESYTPEDIALLQQYTGAGGYKHKTDKPDEGLLWEFYTPDSVVQAMWRLAYKYGFAGGKVLEPSCGTGRLLKYCPPNALADGYEINYYSYRIAQLTYPQHTFYHKSFETLFFDGNRHLKDNHPKRGYYDLVIANPPYGIFSGKYAGMGEKKWTKATRYDHYFITRCLDLLKPGGLGVFLIQFSFLWSGVKSFDPVRHRISQQAELLDAYRLPNGTFQKSSYPPDLVVFRRELH